MLLRLFKYNIIVIKYNICKRKKKNQKNSFCCHASQELDENFIFAPPIIFCHFAEGIGEPKYMPIKDWSQLTKLLDEALVNYNELVIFKII